MKFTRLTKLPTTASKITLALACVVGLAACSSTSTVSSPIVDTYCVEQAQQMADFAQKNQSYPQLSSAATRLKTCVAFPLPQRMSKAQTTQVMQIMADTTLTYFKAGELQKAKDELSDFETRFASQDLYLPDYTSFVDTATALLYGDSLSSQSLASLNISNDLRQELKRKHHWLNH